MHASQTTLRRSPRKLSRKPPARLRTDTNNYYYRLSVPDLVVMIELGVRHHYSGSPDVDVDWGACGMGTGIGRGW
jgi:hypothetical protein